MPKAQTKQQNPVCPMCVSKYTVKKGKRHNRLQTFQIFQCTECEHRFTAGAGRNRTYPLKLILDAISTFNLGHSLTDTKRAIRKRAHLDIPEGTIRSWLNSHKALITYSRLRNAGKNLFTPNTIVQSFTMEHKQVYLFQVHQAKLKLLLQLPAHQCFSPLKSYLARVGKAFPHHLFQTNEHRSSKFPAQLAPPIAGKENHATRLAALLLPSSPTNKKRHEILQRFMLINDSVTIAVEIPVYLTHEDIGYYRSRGFDLDFDSNIITGHIDFLQIRNGYLHILDYKPEARKEKHAHVQLTLYALALSRRTNLPLKDFKCAWFDEKGYFEFFPLKGVYSRKG
jgi:ATP-dependent exoDNAse (exonuclease V) beta subunit/ribosomal protein L37AE/L43A